MSGIKHIDPVELLVWFLLIFLVGLGMPEIATVTDCLERARECAAQADSMTGDDKIQMLAVAEAWLKVADEIAKEATTEANGKPSDAKA